MTEKVECRVCGHEVDVAKTSVMRFYPNPRSGDTEPGAVCAFCYGSGGWSTTGGRVSEEHRLTAYLFHCIEASLDRRLGPA